MSFGFNNIFQRMRNSTAGTGNDFESALTQSTKKTPQLVAPKPPVSLAQHGWNEPPAGISQHRIEPGLWPFRIFNRAGIDPQDNKALHDQLVATPELDPKAFGNRPAAPDDADRSLEKCDVINILSPERLALLENQRSALSVAGDVSKTPHEKDRAKDDLVVALVKEIDLATVGQAAPKLGTDNNKDGKVDVTETSDLARPVLERAPKDPILVEAFNDARERKERMWQAQGRTDDQIGVIARAGDAGDYEKVTSETKKQLVDLALAAGPTEAAQTVALVNRANTYGSFHAGDSEKYQAAIKTGMEQAIKDVRLDRRVDELKSAFGKGDLGGAQAFLAKLREKTNTENTLPGTGALLASDPRVLEMIDKSIDSIANAGVREGEMKEKTQAIVDLAEASQNILYNDGDKPGKGKEVLDHIAKYVVDKMRSDLPDGDGNLLNQKKFLSTVSREDLHGNGTSLVAAISAYSAVEADKNKEAEKFDSNAKSYNAINSNAQWAVRRNIEYFNQASKSLNEDIHKVYSELYHGLVGWGEKVKGDKGVSPDMQLARDMAAIDNLSPENKQKAGKLAELGVTKQKQLETQERILLADKLYKSDTSKVAGQDSEAPIPDMFGTGIVMTKSKSVKEALEALPEFTETPGTIWVQRATRVLATQTVTESLKGIVKNVDIALGQHRRQEILDGSPATPAEQKIMTEIDALDPDSKAALRDAKAALGDQRYKDIVKSKAKPTDAERYKLAGLKTLDTGLEGAIRLSSFGGATLFGMNVAALDASPADLVYYVPHVLMGTLLAKTVVFGPDNKKWLGKGPDADTAAKRLIENAKSNLGSNPSEKIAQKRALDFLEQARRGGIDTLYVGADATNAVLNGGGLAGTDQDSVKALGYSVATLSDAMFAAAAARGADAALKGASETVVSKIIGRIGPLKFNWIAAALQVVGSGTVGSRGAYKAAHTYDKSDADAIQALYGVKDRKTAEMLAEHNDLLDVGPLGVLQTILPGDTQMMGGDEATRSANNVLTRAYAELGYDRARLGELFNRWTPDQAKEVSEKIRDMKAEGDDIPDTQYDLKYLQLPSDPYITGISRYPNIKYSVENRRYEDKETSMYWDDGLWRLQVATNQNGVASVVETTYDPKTGWVERDPQKNTHKVKVASMAGFKAWMKSKGYID